MFGDVHLFVYLFMLSCLNTGQGFRVFVSNQVTLVGSFAQRLIMFNYIYNLQVGGGQLRSCFLFEQKSNTLP